LRNDEGTFSLKYKEEVEALKDEDDFEYLGDAKYINHEDFEARLYWAFCRPSGSLESQIKDEHPLVSIMAFNHSKASALKRFSLIHKDVIADDNLRNKIRNRSRMLFRDLADNDFWELNQVLDLVPVYLDVAIDQLINGRKWNDIVANPVEASIFLNRVQSFLDDSLLDAVYAKLQDFEEFEINDMKVFLENLLEQKEQISEVILKYYVEEVELWVDASDMHLLQQKRISQLAKKLLC
jgi:hypothetical protein